MYRPPRMAGCCSAVLFLALCQGAPAAAGVPTPEEARADETPSETEGIAGRVFRIVRKPLPDLRISQTGLVDSHFDNLSLSTARTTLTAGVAFPLTKRSAVRLRGSGQFAIYEFSGEALAGPTPASELRLGDFYSNRWSLVGRYKFSDRWAGVCGFRVKTSFEDGASYGDAIRWAGMVGFGYRNEANLTLVLGVILGTRLERGGVKVRPLVDFKWQITERFKLESSGLGLRLTGTLNDQLDIFVTSRITGVRYRLANRPLAGPCPPPGGGECIPALGQGSMRDRWVPALVGMDWKFAKHWVLRAHIGAAAYRQIRFYDGDGEQVSSHTANGASLLLGLRVRLRF